MTKRHTVTLPHPWRTGPETTGRCTCGVTFIYGWGGHGFAASEAGEHIEQAANAQPVQTQDLSGEITVMEGLSL